jgi:hypothetical protein
MKLPRRNFLHLAACAAALPAVSRVSMKGAHSPAPAAWVLVLTALLASLWLILCPCGQSGGTFPSGELCANAALRVLLMVTAEGECCNREPDLRLRNRFLNWRWPV